MLKLFSSGLRLLSVPNNTVCEGETHAVMQSLHGNVQCDRLEHNRDLLNLLRVANEHCDLRPLRSAPEPRKFYKINLLPGLGDETKRSILQKQKVGLLGVPMIVILWVIIIR
jgi:hypothetical protein